MHNSNFSKIIDFMNRFSILFHVVLSCGICFLIEWFSRHSFMDAFHFIFDRSFVFLFNALFVFATLSIVYVFRTRVFLRVFISAAWLILGAVNGIVLANRVTPFGFSDITLIGDLYKLRRSYFSVAAEIFIYLAIVIILALLVWLAIKAPKFQGKPRRAVGLVAIVACFFLVPVATDAAVEKEILTDYFENIAKGYKDYGFVYSFSSSIVDKGMDKPDDYSQEDVQNILADLDTEDTLLSQEMPNVICVLLESFVDPNDLNFLEYNQDPTPNFHNLFTNYSSGYLEVPVVGAGTANTEFEILTGMSMDFFGLGEYPYKTILQKNTCESVADVFNSLGYGTHAVHNNDADFYDRMDIFSKFGFDTFTSIEMMNITDWTPTGDWPCDNILVEEIEKTLDATVNQPDFTYGITVQPHGAYPTQQVIENPVITVTGAATEELNYQYEYFMNMLYESDQFIGDLIEMLSNRKEKTIVVFFGDHLPTLGLTESDLHTNSLFQMRYATWNNFGLVNNSKNLTTYQLMSYIMEQLDIHDGNMVKLHQTNEYVITDDYIADMEVLQYDILYGEDYVYDGVDIYPASDIEIGVEEVILTSVTYDNHYLYLKGENFTPWSVAFVNDKDMETEFVDTTLLKIPLDSLKEGENHIMVNQCGDGGNILRSSNNLRIDYNF